MENKYHNEKVVDDNITFDSKKESIRYAYLKLLIRAQEIPSFQYHVKYVLQESFENSQGVHRAAITYTPDFLITNKDGSVYAEDVKGSREIMTPLFSVKQKLFEKRYPDIPLKILEYKNKKWIEITKKRLKDENSAHVSRKSKTAERIQL